MTCAWAHLPVEQDLPRVAADIKGLITGAKCVYSPARKSDAYGSRATERAWPESVFDLLINAPDL